MERIEEMKSSQGAMMLMFAVLSGLSAVATTIVPLVINA
jgi:hypothetical protein